MIQNNKIKYIATLLIALCPLSIFTMTEEITQAKIAEERIKTQIREQELRDEEKNKALLNDIIFSVIYASEIIFFKHTKLGKEVLTECDDLFSQVPLFKHICKAKNSENHPIKNVLEGKENVPKKLGILIIQNKIVTILTCTAIGYQMKKFFFKKNKNNN